MNEPQNSMTPASTPTTFQDQNHIQNYNQKPVRPDKKAQLLHCALQVLHHNFIHAKTPEQRSWLINLNTRSAYPAESETISDTLKAYAFNYAQVDLSRSIIDSAIAIFRQQITPCTTVEFGPTLMTPDGSLYLQTDAGVLVYPKGANLFHFPQILPQVGFITPEQSMPLQAPQMSNGDNKAVLKLFDLINIPQDSQLLIITWIIQCWLPQTQKTLLELVGERRSGKSTALMELQRLTENSTLGYTRDTPQTKKSVHMLAQKNALISLDSVDELKPDVQCALLHSMKGSIIHWTQKRQRQEINVLVTNAVILNSLESVVTEPTLADSTITIELPPITNAHKPLNTTEQYQIFIPIYNALLNILGDVHATRSDWEQSFHLNDNSLAMTTFYNIGSAVAKSLGYDENDFRKQFDNNKQSRFEIALEESPVAYAIRKYMQQESITTTDETVGKLSEILVQCKPEWAKNSDWPATPRSFGDALRKAQPILKQHQILLEPQGKRGGNRRWKISQNPIHKTVQPADN